MQHFFVFFVKYNLVSELRSSSRLLKVKNLSLVENYKQGCYLEVSIFHFLSHLISKYNVIVKSNTIFES